MFNLFTVAGVLDRSLEQASAVNHSMNLTNSADHGLNACDASLKNVKRPKTKTMKLFTPWKSIVLASLDPETFQTLWTTNALIKMNALEIDVNATWLTLFDFTVGCMKTATSFRPST